MNARAIPKVVPIRCVARVAAGLMAAAIVATFDGATAQSPPTAAHRESVDVALHPWSAIGKLNNGIGSCTATLIARDRVLTAAHCVVSARTRRFLPAASLHFLAR